MSFPTKVGKQTAKPRNVLAGIIPTATGWTTPPANLEKCTDGDVINATGTGTSNAAGSIGMLTFDLGYVPTTPILISAVVSIWSSTSSMTIFLGQCDTVGGTYVAQAGIVVKTGTSEMRVPTIPQVISQRFFQLNFYTGGSANGYAKIYEVRGTPL